MFDYDKAFSRNIGWIRDEEQKLLKSKRVAIAGAGGVGGEHLLTLARLGVQNFNISDFDVFEIHNFNRQAGAFISTLDKEKVEVMKAMVLDINPNADVKVFSKGTTEENVDQFLQDVDLYVDSLDFFALDARKLLFEKCEDLSVPVVTAAPLGMGAACLCFKPGGMGFREYFQFNEQDSETDQLLKFLVGLAPAFLHASYLVDRTKADFEAKKGPSTPMGVKMCASVAGSYALKILLNRGDLIVVPKGIHYDGYKNKMKITWRPGGNKNPLQLIALKVAQNTVLNDVKIVVQSPKTDIERIIEAGRWAPSGDNTQPWRFEVLSNNEFRIEGHDTRDWVVYDLEGRASQLAIGCMFENMFIAGRELGYELNVSECSDFSDIKPIFRVKLSPVERVGDPLYANIWTRTVQRRPMGTDLLNLSEKKCLEDSLPEGFKVVWLESKQERSKAAKLMYGNAYTRLSMKEGFEVHSKILDWGKATSEDKIPDKSLGLDPLTLKLMKWSLQSWSRFNFMAKYLGGTIMPRIVLDYIPALKSCAHFIIVAEAEPRSIQDYIRAGRAVQRFWLTSDLLNLGFQPEQTPVIFSEYIRRGVKFTESQETIDNAVKIDLMLKELVGEDTVKKSVFMGRLGRSQRPASRSLRIPLSKLMTKSN